MERQPEPEYMDLEVEAAAYAAADFAEVNAAFVERLLEVAGTIARAVAIDLGTGPGDIPLRVAARRSGWRILAMDASWAMLRRAEQGRNALAVGQGVRFVHADAKRLPVAAGCCDVVFSNSILHHITETAPFWSEVKRVARPGARVLLRDLARPAGAAQARQIVETYAAGESTLLKEEYYRSLLSAYTLEEVRAQLDRAGLAGLQVVRVTDRHLDVLGCVG